MHFSNPMRILGKFGELEPLPTHTVSEALTSCHSGCCRWRCRTVDTLTIILATLAVLGISSTFTMVSLLVLPCVADGACAVHGAAAFRLHPKG
jgi:hypothetical protein